MENIIVEIVISSSGITSDYMLPAHVQIDSLLEELIKLVEQLHPELSFEGDAPLLCSLTDERILPSNLTLAQCGVKDSHKLMLI